MPGLIALLFAVSQARAVIDFPELAADLQGRASPARAALAAILVASGALAAAPIVRPIVFGPRLAFPAAAPRSSGSTARNPSP